MGEVILSGKESIVFLSLSAMIPKLQVRVILLVSMVTCMKVFNVVLENVTRLEVCATHSLLFTHSLSTPFDSQLSYSTLLVATQLLVYGIEI